MKSLRMGWMAVALAGALAACDGSPDNFCIEDADCRDGEFCDLTASSCRCGDRDATNPAGGVSNAAACGVADATTVCNATTDRCEPRCDTDAECASDQVCNTTTHLCEDVAATDCTQSGSECATDKVCDPVSKQCIDQCTASSCGSAKVCNEQTLLCEDDCTATGVTCPSGERCNTETKFCEEGCGEFSCAVTEVCDSELLECVNRCDAANDPTVCESTEFCDTTSGECVAKCEDNDDCTGGLVCRTGDGQCVERCSAESCEAVGAFCDNVTGLCEELNDISECNEEGQPATPREYVDPETNQCTPTTELEQCPAAGGRDAGTRTQSANGPTLFNAVQVGRTTNDPNCGGGTAPSVKIFVEYWDPTGGMLTGAEGSVPYSNVYQSVAAGDSNTLRPIQTCKAGSPGSECFGIASDQRRGAFTFELCRPANATGTSTLAAYASDTLGNFGNAICFDVSDG